MNNIQIILTTHSATITASCKLNSLNVLTIRDKKNPLSTLISDCDLKEESAYFLERWLDITKSTLFFAKGLIFVEGIAEALVIKELSRIVIKEKYTASTNARFLEDFSVSIVNLNGIYFQHFMQLFKGYKVVDSEGKIENVQYVPIRCACITDCDPVKTEKPTHDKKCDCCNPQYYLKEELEENSQNCRMFSNLKTFEYDLAIESTNLLSMVSIFNEWLDTSGNTKTKVSKWLHDLSKWTKDDWNNKKEEKAAIAYELLNFIEESQNKSKQKLGKGQFAQKLAFKLNEDNAEFAVPKYIEDALVWAINR